MKTRSLKKIQNWQFWTREEGVMTVEMVVLFPLIALILISLTEVGFLWFERHTLTNASREGARAAVVYVTEDVNRQNFAETQAQATVDNYLNGINFDRFNTWEVRTTATGSWNPGDPVTVTVETPSGGLLLLDKLIPAFQDIKVSGVTTMRLE